MGILVEWSAASCFIGYNEGGGMFMNKTELMKELHRFDENDSLKLTMYFPTHRSQPDNKQDPILYKNLMSEALDKLGDDAKLFEPQLKAIQNDFDLFNSALDSMVIFMTPSDHVIHKLADQVKAQVVVGKQFHLIPLLHYLDEKHKVYGLDIRKDSFDLYSITRYGKEKIEDHEIITQFSELYDDFDANSNLNFSSQGTYHGHRSSGEEVDNDRLKYFRYLAREFSDKYGDQLEDFVVFGTTENISALKDHFSQDLLSVAKPLRDLEQSELVKEINTALEPGTKEEKETLVSRLMIARDRQLFNNDPEAIKTDIEFGKVEMILLGKKANSELDELIHQALKQNIDIEIHPSMEDSIVSINRF